MALDRKSFILDTSVLLYDKDSIHSFPDNDVIIPLVVLDEVDRFKEKSGILGEYARYVNRFLDDLREKGSLHEGIQLESGQTIRVEINHCTNVPKGLDPSSADNRIIAVAHELSKSLDQKVVVITKDINFRVKCDALGIYSEDYYKDRIISSENQIYSGQKEILISNEAIDKFHNKGSLRISDLDDDDFYPNQFVIAKGNQGTGSLLGMVRGDLIVSLNCDLWDPVSVNPRNRSKNLP